MKIALTNVVIVDPLPGEGLCFTACVLADGERVGLAQSDGRGRAILHVAGTPARERVTAECAYRYPDDPNPIASWLEDTIGHLYHHPECLGLDHFTGGNPHSEDSEP